MCNSAKYSDLGQPFGYLKASTALNCVNLFVMPYNYPVLLPLLGKALPQSPLSMNNLITLLSTDDVVDHEREMFNACPNTHTALCDSSFPLCLTKRNVLLFCR